eukprot:CCRYP_019533-RB/>CCRYP_019533-RB protein AED:0.01 eAED:0.01 QI:28/1/1/1/1/1/2/247/376
MDAPPPPYPCGCELLLSKKPTHSKPTRFAQIQQAFQHSSTYFTITYLYDTCGYGAIASIDIPKHTLILNEPPLIPCDALESVLSRYEKGELKCGKEDAEFMREYYGREFVKLGVEEDAKDEVDRLIGMIWAMHDQYAVSNAGGTEYGNSKRIWGINYSNGFYNSESTYTNNNASPNTSLFRPTLHFLAAKFNHSCSPNVGYDFCQNNQRVFTTRDIRKGEQLFCCYSDIVYHEPAWVRRLFLDQKYHFDCQCNACSGETVTSDEQRCQMKEIAMKLSWRIGAAFLYDKTFDEEVQRITGEYDEEEDDSFFSTIPRQTPNALSDGKLKPTIDDLLDILEYMRLCQEEGLDHDMLHCLELAFDLAAFFNDGEQTSTWG